MEVLKFKMIIDQFVLC